MTIKINILGVENKLVLCSSKDKFVLTQDLCVMCGAVGTDSEGCLIACSQCGQTYHPYCVSIKVSVVFRLLFSVLYELGCTSPLQPAAPSGVAGDREPGLALPGLHGVRGLRLAQRRVAAGAVRRLRHGVAHVLRAAHAARRAARRLALPALPALPGVRHARHAALVRQLHRVRALRLARHVLRLLRALLRRRAHHTVRRLRALAARRLRRHPRRGRRRGLLPSRVSPSVLYVKIKNNKRKALFK